MYNFMLRNKKKYQGHHFIRKVTSLILAFILFVFSGLFAGEYLKHGFAARQIYLENCAACHGFDRTGFVGVSLTPDELAVHSEAAIRSLIRYGIEDTLMPAWKCRLTLKQLRQLSYYLNKIPAEVVKKIKIRPDGNYEAVADIAWWSDTNRIETGLSLFGEYCMGCHHPEIEAFAPSYRDIAGKREISTIIGQIKFPYTSSIILGYTDQIMPVFDLTDNEIKSLGAYVYSFKNIKQ